jgi:mevalonate kinase
VADIRKGVGYAKLLLFGEHAAVYGYPALGIGLDMSTQITLEPGEHFSLPELNDQDQILLEHLLEHAAKRKELIPGRLEIRSDIPRESGLGSSAAFCVALAQIIYQSETNIWEAANYLEEVFHGTPSGIDAGISCFGGTQYFTFDGKKYSFPKREELPATTMHLLIGHIPRKNSTKELVASIRARIEAGDRKTHEQMKGLGALSTQAAELMRGGSLDSQNLGEMSQAAQRLLAEAGVSTDELDTLLSQGINAGALGAKLSGGGGGGSYFFVVKDQDHGEYVLERLKSLNLHLFSRTV